MHLPLPLVFLLLATLSFAVGVDPKAKHALVAFALVVLAVVTYLAPATGRLLAAAQ